MVTMDDEVDVHQPNEIHQLDVLIYLNLGVRIVLVGNDTYPCL